MTTRVRNQRGEGERLRTALLDAATELLAESHDVDQLSVRAVTSRAGVSPTALYLHFEDKEELTRAVRERCTAALGEMLGRADEQHDGDPFAQLKAMGLAYLRFAHEQPGQYAILFHTRVRKDGGHNKTRAPDLGVGDKCFALLVNAVTRCVAKEDEDKVFDLSCELWLSLHGRATIRTAMPDFPLPDEQGYVELLAERMLRRPASA